MTPRLTHVRLLVTEFRACFLFYRDTLEFPVKYGSEDDVYGSFETKDAIVALFDRKAMAEAVGTAGKPAQADCQDRVVLTFQVESVDQKTEQLQAKGVTFLTAPQDRPGWGIRTAHFRDPDGTLIEIYQDLEMG